MAGHFQISVAADGMTVRRVDVLSPGLHVQRKEAGKDPVAFVMSHHVSKAPLETHVYTNLLHRIPLFIATSKKDGWQISGGEIEQIDLSKK